MNSESPITGWPQLTALVCGILAATLGLLVLAGWHTHTLALVHIDPRLVPMAHNTALGFVAAGAALALAAYGRFRWVNGCGTFLGLLAVVTAMQHIFKVNLHTDTLLFRPPAGMGPEYQGVVAPNTGLCFLLTAVNLVLIARRRCQGLCPAVVGTLGAVTGALATTALFGYLADVVPAYQWGDFNKMAAHTATGFMVVAIGIISLAWAKGREESTGVPSWLPVLVSIGSLTMVLLLFEALRTTETAEVTRATKLELNAIAKEITQGVSEHLLLLARMARRWGIHGPPTRADWEADASLYIKDSPDMQAVEWIDASLHIRWIVPLAGNEAVQNMKSALDERRQRALEAARDRRQIVLSEFLTLAQGGVGFLAYVPIYRGDQFDGFIVGVYRTDRFFAALFQDEAPFHAISLFENGQLIYRQRQATPTRASGWEQETAVSLYGVNWRVRVAPTDDLVRNVRSATPEVALGGGILMVALLGAAVHLSLTARRHTRQIQSVNRELELDIAERRRVEMRLRASEERFRAVAQTASDGIITVDSSGRVVSLNAAAEAMFGYAPGELVGQAVVQLMPEGFRSAHQTGWQRALAAPQTNLLGRRLELSGLKKEGAEFPVELSLGQWQTEEGVFFTAICRDVTARKQAEEELRRSETSLRLAQRVGKAGGWELDLTAQTMVWSEETYRIFGRRPEDFAPSRESFYAALPPDDRAKVQAAVEDAVKEGHTFSVDHRIVLPDGTERMLHEQAEVVIDAGTGTVKLAGTVQDVTARQQAAAERERLIDELQEALANVKALSGLLPICSGCKKIRDDKGYWNQIESYIQRHSDAKFSHGMCPDCIKKYFPELDDEP